MILVLVTVVLLAVMAALWVAGSKWPSVGDVFLTGFTAALTALFCTLFIGGGVLVAAHWQVGARIASYEATKSAVGSVRRGDPSYSGILQAALDCNRDLAYGKEANKSFWLDWFYSDRYYSLDLIDMPKAADGR